MIRLLDKLKYFFPRSQFHTESPIEKGKVDPTNQISGFETKFCAILSEIQKIKTDGSPDKLSEVSPLSKFLISQEIQSYNLLVHDKPEEDLLNDIDHIQYYEYVGVEIEILFKGLEFFKYTFQETVIEPPNTKDEENYYQWYPFKSKIKVFIDSDDNLFNLIFMTELGEINIAKKDEKFPLTEKDQILINAIQQQFNGLSGIKIHLQFY